MPKAVLPIVFILIGFFPVTLPGQMSPFPTRADWPWWQMLNIDYLGPPFTTYLTYSKDSSFCGHNWACMVNSNNYYNPIAYYRNDSSRTYFRLNTNCNEPELLAYDFSLNQGDTTHIGMDTSSNGGLMAPFPAVVDTVYFRVFKGVKRKVIWIRFDCDAGAVPWNCNVGWIEGIGALNTPTYNLENYSGISEVFPTLVCLDSIETNIYLADQFISCESVGIDSEIPPAAIRIGPNPFRQKVRIDFLAQTWNEVSLLSVSGRKIESFPPQSSESREIEFRQNLPPGLYFLRVKTSTRVYSLKILRE